MPEEYYKVYARKYGTNLGQHPLAVHRLSSADNFKIRLISHIFEEFLSDLCLFSVLLCFLIFSTPYLRIFY